MPLSWSLAINNQKTVEFILDIYKYASPKKILRDDLNLK